ncbi:GNAT family N-acetyltransferase [Kineosporia succinea]|uniref:GNAT superfamily N-acetyltransferase n=1 Tax=Kineosporia succinea TaxID=84632 RepID=A0ABT9P961_9ACTN|nr:GNAT family N-acetyltransferase [Kineosporia succinea]MDP9829234.1 GNAT superfamily N-acetyltransferase [Kineosporia succinea]
MADWTFRPATDEDLERIADLKVLVIRPHLERLRPWDEASARHYLYVRWHAANVRVIEVGGEFAGCVALRQAEDCRWIEQFYLYPQFQGQGLGTAVIGALLEECDADGQVVRLDVLQQSPARRLYERHGFTLEHEDELDAFLIRRPR